MKIDHLEFYRDGEKKWRWRFVRKNGRILADSAEGYSKRIDAVRAAKLVTGRLPDFNLEPGVEDAVLIRAVIVDD